jgi:hypothetical protein
VNLFQTHGQTIIFNAVLSSPVIELLEEAQIIHLFAAAGMVKFEITTCF